jgi:predicted secreted hydrolase
MNVKALILALVCLMPFPALSQGFAGLGESIDGYALPDPDTRFVYPEDHGAHPDFRIEWWYVTANLSGPDGAAYGIQWTLFRNAMSPTGRPEDQAWMAHAAVSTPNGHLYAERLARGGIGQAGVTAKPFEAFIDEWSMAGPDLNTITLTAQGADFRYDLSLIADRPFVPQGTEGFSIKSEAGQASHYYSQPFYQITGTLELPSGPVEVTGQGWLDREWSSQPLTATQTGWDWVSLHLDGGDKLMGYRLRDQDGTAYTVGTWINADGTPEPLENGDITMTAAGSAKVAGREVPVVWDITLPAKDLTIRAAALYPQSWMGTRIPYWEGPVTVTGSHKGEGYLEMSGY